MGLLNGQTAQQYYDDESGFGNYQFTSLTDIINQFIVAYVGEDKIISKVKRTDVAFHAQRALAELSFDTFKSCKAQEITVPASLQMVLPQDYVNYTKVSWVDSAGIKHLLYPTSKTSNPTRSYLTNSDGDFTLTAVGVLDTTIKDIVLDGEYKDIRPGMLIAPSIFIATGVSFPPRVLTVKNSGGVTTITVGFIIPATGQEVDIFPSLDSSGATLTFLNLDGSLMQETESHIVENLTFGTSNTDQLIVAASASDISNVEVGMLVAHDYFPVGTTVINIHGTTITVSNPSDIAASVLHNPSTNPNQDITFFSINTDSDAWANYKSATPSENQDDYQDDTYWKMNGNRYGLDPQHAQANGSFYIDCKTGKIHFSSNISGKTVILDYISDSLGTDGEMQVHKFAEEAMYKCIAHAVLASRANVPEYQVNRFKKERFAAIRTAKLRLSNIKLEEITQILRGKSKQIKH
jgi:hypothetical protein|tara:strand:- start:637 stop:2028 length:1392 start_codon:yes stop_codon:yes gene_type:complete